jgi:hypothetical protein
MLGLFSQHVQQEEESGPEFYYLPPPQCSRFYGIEQTIKKLDRIIGHGEAEIVGKQPPGDSTNIAFRFKLHSHIP